MKYYLMVVALLLVGVQASAVEWVTLGGREKSRPRPGQTLKWIVASATETTGVITRDLCDEDSSFSINSADGATGAVQTCKEGAAGVVDLTNCEDDLSSGSVTAGNFAFIRHGDYVRLSITGGTAGDLFYFNCQAP